jgi:DNA-binding transcriptional regulator/RsmH inhibitor MraZ
LEYAGLKRDVVLVGNFEWIEIWNVHEYSAEAERLKSSPVDRKRALWPEE